MSHEPRQKPGRSEQTIGTPPALLAAVGRKFGAIVFDLACTADNAVAENFYALEHGDSLVREWPRAGQGLCWLNPPFGKIVPWAQRCASSGAHVAMLVPASVGSNWFRDHVLRRAMVYALSPRVRFVGHTHPFPKDLILCVYGAGAIGFDVWEWQK